MALSDLELFKLSKSFVQSKVADGARLDLAGELESRSVFEWLAEIFPTQFKSEFSDEQKQFWELRWSVLQRMSRGEAIPDHEMTTLLIWARGIGKSTTVEVGAVMAAALLDSTYVLYCADAQDQALEHLGNIRQLILSDETNLLKYYPQMAVTDSDDRLTGLPAADRKDFLTLKNGAIFRAKGLTSKMRGLRVGQQRPNVLIFDDIDNIGESLQVSQSKARLIGASILPVLAPGASIVDFAQNLISNSSVLNQVYTGASDMMSSRTVIGVANAFRSLDIDSSIDDVGRMQHTILPTSIPGWSGLNIPRAQAFLSRSGLQAFMAEYMNEVDQYSSGRVIAEYSEARQVISWSDFERVYGTREIPAIWKKKACVDVGYTDGSQPHYSAWTFVSEASENSALPGRVFLYRGLSFKGVIFDEQIEAVQRSLFRDRLGRVAEDLAYEISHEKTGEMLLMHKHGMKSTKIKNFQSMDGVSQWRHMSRADHKRPNPFREDVQLEDGTWKIGDCQLYYIVDDSQLNFGHDDAGLALFREQVSQWSYVPVKVTDSGMTQMKPSKIADDFCDSFRNLCVYFGPGATKLTPQEKLTKKISTLYPPNSIEQIADESYRAHLYSSKQIKAAEIRKSVTQASKPPEPDWANVG